jgi:hypothetical protein
MTAIGRYQVTGVIGAGGFGTVYLGTDPSDGSPVAVKVLDRGNLADPEFRTRMRAEAAAMCRVADEHCVRVRDVVDEPDVAAIVTDFVDGASLRAVLDRHGRLSGPQSLDVLSGALHGLIAVHRAGLLHGDLKPDNVLVDRRGVSRLIDFGLAAAPATIAKDGRLTGSPSYLSPEQIRGEPADVRSDVYACAVMLFELLCGVRPYAGPSVDAVLVAHLSAPVPDPRMHDPTITEQFARLCTSALAKDPAVRPQSAAEFLAALEDAARQRYGAAWRTGVGIGALVGGLGAGGVVSARAAAGLGRARRGLRLGSRLGRRAVFATGGAVVVAAVVIVTLVATAKHGHSPPAALTGRLLVTGFPAGLEYHIVDPTGTLVTQRRRTSPLCCTAVTLSPDGKRALVRGEGFLGTETIGGGAAAGQTLWSSGIESAGAAVWSPDGTRVAFSTLDYSTPVPSSDVDVINADGSRLRVVAHGLDVESIAWSPNGRRLAFLQQQGGIWVVPANGGTAHDILRGPRRLDKFQSELSWAPADRLLFVQERPAPNGVWTVAADGSGLHNLLAGARSPSWGPDARHFAAVIRGRVVIADSAGRVARTIVPRGISTVQWSR